MGKNDAISDKLSINKITAIYIGSVLLSPFSLYWFFKYFRDRDNKKIAYISLVITVVSLVVAIVVTVFYISSLNNYIDEYRKSFEGLL